MTFDPNLGGLVMVGNDSSLIEPSTTWLLRSSGWELLAPATPLPGTERYSIATDTLRSRVVLFGGDRVSFVRTDETWEWDGSTWTRVTPATGRPSPRAGHVSCFDPSRGVTILFGGEDVNGILLNDTWQWDGIAWSIHQPLVSPPPLAAAAMCFDPVRGEVLLFGGRDATGASSGDCWRWNGTNWRYAGPGPGARQAHGMAWDARRSRAVVFGGFAAANRQQPLGDTWEWDGLAWSMVATSRPPAVGEHALAFDPVRGLTVKFGGLGQNQALSPATWGWDGTTWEDLGALSPPDRRLFVTMSFDPGTRECLVFGGPFGDETFTWNGVRWREIVPRTHPPMRDTHSMAADPLTGRPILFGGQGTSPVRVLDDTWEWTGADWRQLTPMYRPQPRWQSAMATDLRRRRIVLFGGVNATSSGFYGDTWEWNGRDWLPRATNGPPGRRGHQLAYDEVRGVVVLFAGEGQPAFGQSVTEFDDTWEWAGRGWVRRYTAISPPARLDHAMVWDPLRQRVVVIGGHAPRSGSMLSDTWEWDGTNWTQVFTPFFPTPRRGAAAAFDGQRERVVLFGGHPLFGRIADHTWEYSTDHIARVESYGNGCPGSAGVPRLRTAPGTLPWLGATVEIVVDGIPPTVGVIVFGASRTFWGPFVLPFDLAPLGMPGCELLVSLDATVGLMSAASTTTVNLTIPVFAPLVGVQLFAQANAVDPGSNMLGVSVSNGLALTIGAR